MLRVWRSSLLPVLAFEADNLATFTHAEPLPSIPCVVWLPSKALKSHAKGLALFVAAGADLLESLDSVSRWRCRS